MDATDQLALVARLCFPKLHFRQGYASKPPDCMHRHSDQRPPHSPFCGKVMVSTRQSFGLSHTGRHQFDDEFRAKRGSVFFLFAG
jgi:hypothetical protein